MSYFCQECAGEDLSDLYLQEKQEQLKQAASAKLKYQMTVPGILNPHEVSEENMNDWALLAPFFSNLAEREQAESLNCCKSPVVCIKRRTGHRMAWSLDERVFLSLNHVEWNPMFSYVVTIDFHMVPFSYLSTVIGSN